MNRIAIIAAVAALIACVYSLHRRVVSLEIMSMDFSYHFGYKCNFPFVGSFKR